MSSFEKIVKSACKPKAAPPKAKYLDPIVMATYSEDGSVGDIFKALAPRLREPNAVIVFKGLIVLHTMMRNGSTDNVLSYLSQSDVLKLHNVASGQWEGYDAPQNLVRYAVYLETRVRAYKDLQHDTIRVQSESNRDANISNEPEGRKSKKGGSSVPQRSKTVMGRKLRSMSVEKGLLRETRIVQKQMDALLACKLYLDDLEDEITITALRLLVKDLLVLFQAVNEGVINVLEHYFEMSHVDAEESLKIYRHFCKEAEAVVEYLSVAKKMQKLLNVPIPNLKHAPVSLAGALQEYLNDPHFEQNRLEYKQNKDIADGKATAKPVEAKKPETTSIATPSNNAQQASVAAGSSQPAAPNANKDLVDFFASIEHGQQDMFNPHTNSPSSLYFAQQAASNPFHQRHSMLMPQATGVFPGTAGFPSAMPFVQAQATGFPGRFGAGMPTSFLQPVQTGVPSTFPQLQPQMQTGLLQPQPTGANPFRQSILMPQSTGMPPMGATPMGMAHQMPHTAPMRSMSAFEAPPGPTQIPFSTQPTFQSSPFGHQQLATPQRSASTPLTNNPLSQSTSSASGPAAAPLVPMKTGSRNPFAPSTEISAPPPPPPPVPTLNTLRTGSPWTQPTQNQTNGQSFAPQPPKTNGAGNGTGGGPSSFMSNVASEFSTNKTENHSHPFSNSAFGGSSNFSSLSTPFSTTAKPNEPVPTPFPGAGTSSSPFSGSGATNSPFSFAATNAVNGQDKATPAPLQTQPTGFAGSSVKVFQPTSSFGASLLASLPPISSPTSTNAPSTASAPNAASPAPPSGSAFSTMSSNGTGISSAPTGLSNFSGFSGSTATSQPSQTGQLSAPQSSFGPNFSSSVNNAFGGGNGLMPQATGAPNPFRASMFNPSGPPPASFPGSGTSAFGGGNTPFGTQQFGASSNSGANLSPFAQQPFTQQNQNQSTTFGSLI